jgi:hypothetical protein
MRISRLTCWHWNSTVGSNISIIIINRARVRKQLEVIDDPAADIYPRLTSAEKDVVEQIRAKSPQDTMLEDFHTLLDICKGC